MTDLVALFNGSLDRFIDRVARVDDGQWSAATPCSEWSVRDLVNHVIYEQLWAPHLVAGETIAEVGGRYDGDILGSDALATARRAAADSQSAFGAADLDATVHLSYADVPCRDYLSQMLTDAEVHGWDLAIATGQEPTIDAEVAAVLLPVATEQEDLLRGSGMFGELQPVPHDADDATRLLAVLGRRPS